MRWWRVPGPFRLPYQMAVAGSPVRFNQAQSAQIDADAALQKIFGGEGGGGAGRVARV